MLASTAWGNYRESEWDPQSSPFRGRANSDHREELNATYRGIILWGYLVPLHAQQYWKSLSPTYCQAGRGKAGDASHPALGKSGVRSLGMDL